MKKILGVTLIAFFVIGGVLLYQEHKSEKEKQIKTIQNESDNLNEGNKLNEDNWNVRPKEFRGENKLKLSQSN